MPKSNAITVRLRPDVSEKLDALARDTKRSASDLAREAIESYVDLSAWQTAHIRAALAEDQAGGPTASHDEVVRWMQSWDTDRELPRPQAKKT
ncbi:MAG TPA: ribbon-helix-helix protein, CopG family [Stellaceae bacterium]|nr:ribbon-helix-helix protein, CopG family [Stellaceae bacterium]